MIASEVPIDVGVGNIVETSIDIETMSLVVEVEIEAEVMSVAAEVEIETEVKNVAAEVEIEIDTSVKAQTVSTVKKVTLVETKWRSVKRCLLGRKMLLILLL
jgi:hypothetical protein